MIRKAKAHWRGTGKDGTGDLTSDSGVLSGTPYSFKTRFQGEKGTNPEELIAAAHAGCFAMQLSAYLADNGTPPEELEVTAAVELIPGTGITGSALTLKGRVPGIDRGKFMELAEKAKTNCPVSRALGAINVTLDAALA